MLHTFHQFTITDCFRRRNILFSSWNSLSTRLRCIFRCMFICKCLTRCIIGSVCWNFFRGRYSLSKRNEQNYYQDTYEITDTVSVELQFCQPLEKSHYQLITQHLILYHSALMTIILPHVNPQAIKPIDLQYEHVVILQQIRCSSANILLPYFIFIFLKLDLKSMYVLLLCIYLGLDFQGPKPNPWSQFPGRGWKLMTLFPHEQLQVNSLQNQISQESTQANVWFVPTFCWRTLGLAMFFGTTDVLRFSRK